MFPVKVSCPSCSRTLLNGDRQIHGNPSVHVSISYNDERGDLFLSSLYGDFYSESTLTVPEKAVVKFSCPNCSVDLAVAKVCRDCGAAMVRMIIGADGEVEICSRHGCRRHAIAFGDMQRVALANFMQRDVSYIYKNTPLLEVARIFRTERCRELPVVNESQRPVGVLGVQTLLQHMYPAELGEANLQTFDSVLKDIEWLELTAGDIMKPIMHVMDPDTPILDVGLYMIRENVPFVVVCKQKVLVGVVSLDDINTALIDRKLNVG